MSPVNSMFVCIKKTKTKWSANLFLKWPISIIGKMLNIGADNRSTPTLLCHSSTTITSCCSMIMHGPMLQGSRNIPVIAWPAYSLDMSPIEHVWDALDWRIRQHVPVPANIQQLHTAIEEEWTNIPQATINNLINSMRRRCVALRAANGGHTRYWLVFEPPAPPTPPPNTEKLHILEWPFIVASLRHTCAIIMLSNQHLDMPHLWDELSRQRRSAH